MIYHFKNKNYERIKSLEKEIKLLKELRKLKKEDNAAPKKGWYKSLNNDKFLMYWDGYEYQYGIDGTGKWLDGTGIDMQLCHKEAKDKEVELFLIEEAKRRGFKKGVEFASANGGTKFTCSDNRWFPEIFTNTMWDDDCGIIFKDGKWAKIIKDEPLTINGKMVKITDSQVIIGCMTKSRVEFEAFVQSLNDFDIRLVQHLHIGNVRTSQLEKIIDKLN